MSLYKTSATLHMTRTAELNTPGNFALQNPACVDCRVSSTHESDTKTWVTTLKSVLEEPSVRQQMHITDV